jgi:hypothetical protein
MKRFSIDRLGRVGETCQRGAVLPFWQRRWFVWQLEAKCVPTRYEERKCFSVSDLRKWGEPRIELAELMPFWKMPYWQMKIRGACENRPRTTILRISEEHSRGGDEKRTAFYGSSVCAKCFDETGAEEEDRRTR